MRPAGSRQMTRLAEVCVLLVHWHHHPGGPEPTLRVAVGSCRLRRVRMSRKPQRWSSLRSGPSPAPSRATDRGCTSLAGDLNRNTLTNLKRDGTWHASFTGKTTLAAQAPRTLLSETTGTPRAPAERMMARSFWPVPTCKAGSVAERLSMERGTPCAEQQAPIQAWWDIMPHKNTSPCYVCDAIYAVR